MEQPRLIILLKYIEVDLVQSMSVIFHTQEAHNNTAKLQILSTNITSSDIICCTLQAARQHQLVTSVPPSYVPARGLAYGQFAT
jgi:hypothetical protein